MGIKRK